MTNPKFEITQILDGYISDMHHITVEHNGYSYGVIFGRYINGGFCCIPGRGISCDLSSRFDDTFYNTESLSRVMKSKKTAAAIAEAIALAAEIAEGKVDG